MHGTPCAAERARDFLRCSLCAACWAEFFLYEKMGRRAIDHAESVSKAGTEILPPITPKRWDSKGTRLFGESARAELSRPSDYAETWLHPNPSSRTADVNRKQTSSPIPVGIRTESAVHFQLPVSFRMVMQVVEQGQ